MISADRDALTIAGLITAALGLSLAAHYFAGRGGWTISLVLIVAGVLLGLYVLVRLWPRLLRPRFSYQWTGAGALYLLSVAAVAAGALSSANNLLFLILACQLAALVVSGLFSRLNLASLELQCVMPDHVFAGQDVPVRLALRNLKRWMASFSIRLRIELRLPDSPEVYFAMLPGGRTASMVVNVRFPRRGAYRQDTFWLRSGFPFGFVIKGARLSIPRDLLVYPSVAPAPDLESSWPRLSSQWEMHRVGLGQDLYRIRPYQTGDSSRVVHWKATAHTGELKVREFAGEEDRRVEMVFDCSVPPGFYWYSRFEKGVALCASIAWRLHSRGAGLRFEPGGLEDIYDILRYLALVDAEEGPSRLRMEPHGSFQVIFTARPDHVAASLPESSYYCYDLESL